MDKWQKLKGFLAEGKQNIPKDLLVSKSILCEEILDIMEELEKREFSELRGENNGSEIKTTYKGKPLKYSENGLHKKLSELKGEKRMSFYGMSEEESLNYWAKGFFKGKCPYTGKKCEEWNCNECEVEKAERERLEENKE